MEEREYGIESAEYRRSLEDTTLVLRKNGIYTEDYQMRMLEENSIKGLLKVTSGGTENTSVFEYDVSGKKTMRRIYKDRAISTEEMKKFSLAVSELVRNVRAYLLDIDRILLDPDYIFWEDGQYEFCYFPGGGWDIWKAFHKITECFVQWTDYENQSSIRTAFLLHKETMSENYSLKKIIGKMEEETAEGEVLYDRSDHDWITSQEMGSSILQETDNMWRPVKKFLKRHRKPAWKEWDGIYIEEEEL